MKRVVLALVLVCVGCGHPAPGLPPIATASRIEVRNNRNERVGLIEEPAHVARIVAFIAERRSGWEAPWYGPPVPIVDLVVFQESSPVFTFGAGASFFAAHHQGIFATRAASAEEIAAFKALLEPALGKAGRP